MIQNLGFAANAAWQVLLISLILGAGLPTLFALGIRSLSWGTAHGTAGDHQTHPLGKVIAYILFGLVVLFVLLGVLIIVLSGFGMKLGFDNGIPTFTK